MSGLNLVRGTVIDAKSFMVSEISATGTGKDAQIGSMSVEYQEVWLQIDGRETAIKSPATTAFRPGHIAAFVLRDRNVLFALNETSGAFGALPSRFVPWEGAVSMFAFLTMLGGMFGVVLMGGGAPIGHYALPMLVAPIPVAVWSWRSRRRTLADCWKMTGWNPS